MAAPLSEQAKALCMALQNGESPAGLADMIWTRTGARGFFSTYLNGEEYSCADADRPPSVLTDILAEAPVEVMEVMLMNVALGAVKSGPTARQCTRARSLVDALWYRSPIMQRSCAAFIESVAAQLGESVTEYDAAGGDIELLRIQWSSLLRVVNYNEDQLAAVREALELCGGEGAGEPPDEDDEDD